MTTDQNHQDQHDQLQQFLGAYLLGGLSDDDHRAFTEHLRACQTCQQELGQVSGLPRLLSLVDAPTQVPYAAEPAPDQLRAGAWPGPPALAWLTSSMPLDVGDGGDGRGSPPPPLGRRGGLRRRGVAWARRCSTRRHRRSTSPPRQRARRRRWGSTW